MILKLQYPFIIGDALPNDITAITKANPGVVSSVAHTKATGDIVYFAGLSEMVELNEAIRFVIAVGGADEFSIDDTSRYALAEATGGACGWSAESYKGEKATLIFKLNLIDRLICSTQPSISCALRRCDTGISNREQRGCMYTINY